MNLLRTFCRENPSYSISTIRHAIERGDFQPETVNVGKRTFIFLSEEDIRVIKQEYPRWRFDTTERQKAWGRHIAQIAKAKRAAAKASKPPAPSATHQCVHGQSVTYSTNGTGGTQMLGPWQTATERRLVQMETDIAWMRRKLEQQDGDGK
jgi:hypothetical protein